MANEITGTSADETMLGTSGDDIFQASGGDDRIWGGTGGNDQLVLTGTSDDYAITDNGNGSYTLRDLRDGSPDGTDVIRAIDSLVFADTTMTLDAFVTARAHFIYGDGADNTLLGTAGDDVFVASAGNDRFWGGNSGDDTVRYSGQLDDYEIVDNGNGSYTITDLRNGSPDGSDTVRDIEFFQFSDHTVSLDGLLAAGTASQAGGSGDDQVLGTAGDDIMTGGGGNDRIWGGTGGEDVANYSGNLADYAIWDRGDGSYLVKDLRSGAPDGDDIVRDVEVFSFADRNATLGEFIDAYVEPEFKVIYGTGGNDVVIGTEGDDVFYAYAGNDRVWGGQGGTDKLVLTGNVSDYVITDNETGGAYTFVDTRANSPDGTKVVRDIETIAFADGEIAWADLLTQHSSNSVTEDYAGTAAAETMSGAHTDGLHDAHSNDQLVGNAGTDWLRGGPGDDIIYGDDQASANATAPVRTSFPTTNLAPFNFEEGLYQVINGQLNKLDPATGTYIPIGQDQDNYNAIGLNDADGYAYGIGSKNTEFAGFLLRIGADGGVEPLIGGLPSIAAGTFGADGRLYIKTGAKEMLAINVETFATETISFTGDRPGAVHDLVFIADDGDGKFYGLSKNGQLVNYDLTTQTVSQVTVDNLYERGPFGAGWTAADGGLYFSDNSTGNIYGISGIENGQPQAALLAVGGTSSINDGFSYGTAPLPQFLRVDGVDYLLGGSGNDTLIGGDGGDFLDGGLGADMLNGGDGMDTADYTRATSGVVADLSGGGTGGEANGDSYVSVERIEGSAYADTLTGDGAANVLRGRAGDDVLNGGSGDDLLRGDAGADTLDGGDGLDTASYFEADTGVTIDLATGQGTGGVAEGDQLSNIEAVQGSNTGDDNLSGSDGVDQLYGFGGNDTLSGRGGSDTIHGGDGNDIIDGGDAADFLLGQAGADTVSGGNGADNVQGGLGDDILNGNAGDDRLFGGAGGDTLNGGADNDHLRGGAGNDILTGGSGADTFHFSDISNDDQITDFELGIDTIDLSDVGSLTGISDLTFSAGQNGVLVEYASESISIELHGVDIASTGEIDFLI